MKLEAFYHVYLTDDPGFWASIVLEQLEEAENSGLMGALSALHITVMHRSDQQFEMFKDLVSCEWNTHKPLNITIHHIKVNDENDDEMIQLLESGPSDETITHRAMYHRSKAERYPENTAYLYFHTKGITSSSRFLKNGDSRSFRRYFYWRKMLNWGALTKWKDCVSLLSTGMDVIGPNLKMEPCPHYSGSFWWAKASHISTLNDPFDNHWWTDIQNSTEDPWLKSCSLRYKSEMWILSNHKSTLYGSSTLSTWELSPAVEEIPRRVYDV